MPAWTSPAISEPRAAPAPPRWAAVPSLLCALPGALLGWHAWRGTAGADPLAALVHGTGWWALALLLATLGAGALKRLALRLARRLAWRFGRRGEDWNPVVRLRRQLGLWALAYALAHVALYAVLEAGSWRELVLDLSERPFLVWGAVALALLLPLGATSNRLARERLGPHWAVLHRGVYLAVAFALWHDWAQTKHGADRPWFFGGLFLLLVLLRGRAWLRGDRSPTVEAPSRRPR